MPYVVTFFHTEQTSVLPLGSEEIEEGDLARYKENAVDIIRAAGEAMDAETRPNAMLIVDELEAEVFRAKLDPTPL